jgi:hypothetical protein
VASVRVFISYRREDSSWVTGRIRDSLARSLRAANVFYDVDSIPLGQDFRRVIDSTLEQVDVMVVVIGKRWVDAVDAQGRRRLDLPNDFVRIEVETALNKGIPVIPVLIDDAAVPDSSELPDTLTELAFRNGMAVRHDPYYKADMARLTRQIRTLAPVVEPPKAESDPAPRGQAVTEPPAVYVPSKDEAKTRKRFLKYKASFKVGAQVLGRVFREDSNGVYVDLGDDGNAPGHVTGLIPPSEMIHHKGSDLRTAVGTLAICEIIRFDAERLLVILKPVGMRFRQRSR